MGSRPHGKLCLKEHPPLIVFVTAYDAYALDAFEAAAIDYLLKPVEDARLAKCIERLSSQLSRGSGDNTPADMATRIAELLGYNAPRKEKLRFVRAGAGTTVKLIPVQEVLWFEAEDKYITVATREGDSIIRMPLRELLEQLDEEIFWQIHRGTVVNSTHIAHAKRDELGHLTLTLKGRNDEIPVSRQFAHLSNRCKARSNRPFFFRPHGARNASEQIDCLEFERNLGCTDQFRRHACRR